MASTIGGTSVDIVRGLPQVLKTELDIWRVPGIDGYGALTLGLGDAEFNFIAVKYIFGGDFDENDDDANDLITTLNEMQGTIITVVDDWDDTYDKILVQHVDSSQAKKPCIYMGDPNAIRVQIVFKALTASPPD